VSGGHTFESPGGWEVAGIYYTAAAATG